jgi:hypothetical protein
MPEALTAALGVTDIRPAARAVERRREHGLTVLVATQAALLFFVGPLVARR